MFDIDGTLINTGGAGGAALRDAFSSEFAVDQPADVPFAGRTDRGIGSNLFREHGIEDSEDNWQRLCAGYLQRLPFHLRQRDGRVLAGVAELLQQIRPCERTVLGLLTGNTADGARIKLSYYGLFDHFAFGGFGDTHRDRDHVAQEALEAAKRHRNGQPDEASLWVVGDTPLDVRCARAIGARVLAVATGWHSAEELEASEPDALLPDLSDTEQVLSVFDERMT